MIKTGLLNSKAKVEKSDIMKKDIRDDILPKKYSEYDKYMVRPIFLYK